MKENLQETSNQYSGIVFQIDHKHRIIRCKDNIQYISQIKTGGNSRWPWRSVSYYTSKQGAQRQREAFKKAALSLFEGSQSHVEATGKPISTF